MSGFRSKSIIITIFSFISLVLVACGVETQAPAVEELNSTAALTDIASVDELQSMFNQDTGSTRLVLLLSPT